VVWVVREQLDGTKEGGDWRYEEVSEGLDNWD